jgi:hypothetical protein
MIHSEIDAILNKKNDEVVEAHKEIVDLQKGVGHTIFTGLDHLDYFLIGGLNNKMVFIGSRPSMGKTYHCESTINSLLNEKINPNQNISILRLNLEMQTRSLLLRDLKKSLNKKMRDIISTPYTEEEQKIVKQVVAKHRDPRIVNFSRIVEGEDLRYLINKYRQNIDDQDNLVNKPSYDAWKSNWDTLSDEEQKTAKRYTPVQVTQKIILVDHIHIYQSKKQIDDILTIMNEFKMLDKNLSFIIYFQFNRTLEDVWRDSKEKKANPKNFLPNSSHIYNTDSLMQYADIILGMVIPQVVDIDEFVSVYKERNMHLESHFLDGSEDNVTVRLKGRNRIFYNYIKTRLTDDFEDPRLYCSILDEKYEESANRIFQQNKNPFVSTSIDIPIFNKDMFETNKIIEPIVGFHNIGDVFDAPVSKKLDNDVPF